MRDFTKREIIALAAAIVVVLLAVIAAQQIVIQKSDAKNCQPAKEMLVEVTAFSTNGGFTKFSVVNRTIPIDTFSMQFSTDSRYVRENNITSWGIALYNV